MIYIHYIIDEYSPGKRRPVAITTDPDFNTAILSPFQTLSFDEWADIDEGRAMIASLNSGDDDNEPEFYIDAQGVIQRNEGWVKRALPV